LQGGNRCPYRFAVSMCDRLMIRGLFGPIRGLVVRTGSARDFFRRGRGKNHEKFAPTLGGHISKTNIFVLR
jgi:hypothetical protein